MNPYAALVNDHGLYCYLNTELPLPASRETVLHYFESMQKVYPTLRNFTSRESGEHLLEEDKEDGSYRWLALEHRRVCTGYVNPPTLEAADAQHEKVIQTAPFHFGINGLDAEALDVVFVFDLIFAGNHDDVVAEAFGLKSPLAPFFSVPGAKIMKYEPIILLALDLEADLHCRLAIETRTNPFQVRTGQFQDDPISVFFTVRRYWHGEPADEFLEAYRKQREILQDMTDQLVVPTVLQPLARVIAEKSS
ncbi:MAG TPA: hypothetical protein PKD86_02405 [Gemmatales bacterium]|nr:hypothetical protein [Gemmatales bacterium]HMP58182.1 hypothetical protein [Gemmatales bacterium]